LLVSGIQPSQLERNPWTTQDKRCPHNVFITATSQEIHCRLTEVDPETLEKLEEVQNGLQMKEGGVIDLGQDEGIICI